MQKDTTLYKLMILFILSKVDYLLTNIQISNFLLDREYTDYFTIQQVLNDLISTDLVHVDPIRNRSYYKILPEGSKTLALFENRISNAAKKDMLDYLKENDYTLREEVSTLSDYYKEKTDQYMVRCQVMEGKIQIIDLTLSVTSQKEAESICINWKKKSQEVYSYLMQSLMLSIPQGEDSNEE